MPGSHPIGRVAACRRAACVCAAIVAAILLSFWSEPLAAQTPPDVQSLADQAIRRLNLQTELPRSPEPFRFNLKLPPELLWVVVIVGLGIVLYAFRDMIPMLGSRRHSDWTGEDERRAKRDRTRPALRSARRTSLPLRAVSLKPCMCCSFRCSRRCGGGWTSRSPIR